MFTIARSNCTVPHMYICMWCVHMYIYGMNVYIHGYVHLDGMPSFPLNKKGNGRASRRSGTL